MENLNQKPILFSTPMVDALLEGRKTVTRRAVKGTALAWLNDGFLPDFVADPANSTVCPYGKVGDLLWVRETWMLVPPNHIVYKGGLGSDLTKHVNGNWKPSIHLPRKDARIWLQITNIRVERLHDITEEDILKEGVRYPVNNGRLCFNIGIENGASSFIPKGSFEKGAPALSEYQILFAHWAELWCKINGRESWDANPWVWAIEFKPVSLCGFYQIKIG